MRYDLRRLRLWLRLHGIIERIPATHRYELTDEGLYTAVAYTLAHDRIVRPGLAELADPALPSEL